ncbi:hypothetical protein, partial [Dysosmobacter sp.]|uniref:hypothetical protein n=1 Tax=Dysosmobacter sp. TaxID=2591382 RepID=UPI003AB350A5
MITGIPPENAWQNSQNFYSAQIRIISWENSSVKANFKKGGDFPAFFGLCGAKSGAAESSAAPL